ncbi:MAG: hypothetical protein HY911_01835 [Desulfobacterales bacterium]|nr:hypothetical protein [Desulfobacterales bacterium]
MLQPAATLQLKLPPAAIGHFSTLFSAGVGIKTIAGISLSDLLCRQLAIAPEYVERRIQTIFLNHRAVDRTEQVIVPAKAILALSAAMPGLVGATFRKGGALAAFREDISYRNSPVPPPDSSQNDTLITLKLFNLVARELGPHLLSLGVWIDSPILKPLLSQLQAATPMPIETCRWNDREVPPTQLSELCRPEGWVALTVAWHPPL